MTDNHEDVNALDAALAHFHRQSVEQVVVIGDVYKTGKRIEETCLRLLDVSAVGVWGNHDFNIRHPAAGHSSNDHRDPVVQYMRSLEPSLEIAGCYFMHNEPWLDPHRLEDLWFLEGPPCEPARFDKIFSAVPHPWTIAGHFHRWLLASPDGVQG